MATMTKEQSSVLRNKEAMNIIIEEAKKIIALKFDCSVRFVEIGISARNENMRSMMNKLVKSGINQVADKLKKEAA